MASIFANGIALSNFRGIGPDIERIAPFKEINFFIGPNNVGKSTVLAFLANHLNPKTSATGDRWRRKFDGLDVHLGRNPSEVKWGLAVPPSAFEGLVPSGVLLERLHAILETFTRKGLVWLFPADDGRALTFGNDAASKAKPALRPEHWQHLWTHLTAQGRGSLDVHWVPETLVRIANAADVSFPAVHFIPAIREVGPSGATFEDFSGRGLIDKLAELQNPPHDQRHNISKFEKINEFLRAATESDDAKIEVPFDRRYLLVHMGGKVLPLASLGTGIHEVIMMASFCTLVENEIICIEEPEIHLHPLLQRRFIRYLRDQTSNQYFVATHSASLIDSVQSSIFSVTRNEEGKVDVSLAATPSERYEICRQLGYQASDLLQANAVIWVEGPSDRIYVNYWIRVLAPELVEGMDYSVMFYGGRLLSHLTANDPEIEEFISLRRLNRNIAILIDSDKRSAGARLNETKRRIISEFGDASAWVTAGREVENYVPAEVVSKVLNSLYPSRFDRIDDDGRFGHRLYFRTRAGDLVEKVDKVKIASMAVAEEFDLSELDLKKKAIALVEFVRHARA